MRIEVKVPQLPESVEDATVMAWHKQPGETVDRADNLLDLETDKVVLEVPAPGPGVLAEVLVKQGDVVKSGDVVAILTEGSGEGAAAATPGKQAAPASAAPIEASAPATPEADAEQALSPAVRRLIVENNLDAKAIPASGRDGRLTKEDVLAFMAQGKPSAPAPAASPAPAAAPAASAREPAAEPADRGRLEQRVAMTRLRARVAERLVQAQQTAAILTTFNEVDLSAVNELRRHYRDSFEKAHGVRLGYMSFFIKACVEALKRFPVINASVDGTDIVYHGYFDIGIAVASPRGLVVPIVRDADQLGFAELEKQVQAYGEKARDGGLSIEDLTGGTFSITNGGVFGSLLSTPILNPPQSAILGMHKIQERPVVVDGQIVVRPMMYLALSYDHRLIDGREAVQFLVTVKDLLEDPARLLLQV
ncbi:MAG TPA: 2-oxoglutarate dehydrogenase complex dihydrolipoyllysine-residue succinyltransferase [Candidatus Acidoferrales bacterium]|nr:2-oxoglutarate dehydrogenase complex dihydrolipoyllysine-residue succinyltransferase [Candidatus Acidoferrales bacterium]